MGWKGGLLANECVLLTPPRARERERVQHLEPRLDIGPGRDEQFDGRRVTMNSRRVQRGASALLD
jgi:hypothetical protein